jgi:V/A-type H+-transporting ATPase subunit K
LNGASMVAIAKAVSAMLAIALSAWATAYAQSKIGAAGAGAMAEKPEVAGTVFILVAIPETMVVLGFAIALMIMILVKV